MWFWRSSPGLCSCSVSALPTQPCLMPCDGGCFSLSSHPGEETGPQRDVERGITWVVRVVPWDGILISTDRNLLAKITIFFSGLCWPPLWCGSTQRSSIQLLSPLPQMEARLVSGEKPGDKLKTENQATEWKAMTKGFHRVWWLLEWLTLSKAKSGSSSKQQKIEKQINGNSSGSFPETLSDAVTKLNNAFTA